MQPTAHSIEVNDEFFETNKLYICDRCLNAFTKNGYLVSHQLSLCK